MNHPPTENGTLNITREYICSQNGKNISSRPIDSAYNKFVVGIKTIPFCHREHEEILK